MKKNLTWIIAAIVIIVLILIFIPFHKTPPTKTVLVKEGTISEKVVAVGQIVPLQISQIKSHIPGQVSKIFVKEGDYVKAGEKLITISPSPTPNEYAQAVSSFAQAKSNLEKSQGDYQREQELVKRGLIIQKSQDLASAKQQYLSNQAAYNLAEEQLDLLKSGKTTIAGQAAQNTVTSPVAGYVLQKDIDIGDSVVPVTDSQAGTILFAIAKMKPLIFKGQISQIDVNRLKPGMKATLNVASLPHQKITGTVSTISLMDTNQENTNTGQDAGNSLFDSPDAYTHGFNIQVNQLQIPAHIKLRAGYQATATIITQTKHNILVLPQRVIHFDKNKPYVWLLGTHKKRSKQAVTIGLSDNVNAEITKGIQAGQHVVDQ